MESKFEHWQYGYNKENLNEWFESHHQFEEFVMKYWSYYYKKYPKFISNYLQ